MNKFLIAVGLLLLIVGIVLITLPDPAPAPIRATYFNASAYLTQAHLPLNTLHKFIQQDGHEMTGCAYEYLPDGRTLLVVTPPEWDACQ